MNNESEKKWKEMAISCSKILPHNLLGGIEGTHKKR
jgi:hypothetical protein